MPWKSSSSNESSLIPIQPSVSSPSFFLVAGMGSRYPDVQLATHTPLRSPHSFDSMVASLVAGVDCGEDDDDGEMWMILRWMRG